jgi:hypothetical protein
MAMKSKKNTNTRKSPALAKKPAPRRKAKRVASKLPPLTYQRKVEQDFIGAHPEAFEPYVGQWVAMDGAAIVAHGDDYLVVANEARARAKDPYMFRVLKHKPNEGFLF